MTDILSLPNHSAPVAFSADGTYLAANTRAGVRIVSSSDGQIVSELPDASHRSRSAPLAASWFRTAAME